MLSLVVVFASVVVTCSAGRINEMRGFGYEPVPCENGFYCEQSQLCIPTEFVCDQDVDCLYEEDEVNCSAVDCPPETHFRCMSGQCIPNDWRCDGTYDCRNLDDELNCTSTHCSEYRHRCGDGSCVAFVMVCDGENDCSDGSDETREACEKWCVDTYGKTLCSESNTCIWSSQVCDEEVDCPNGEDEFECERDLQ